MERFDIDVGYRDEPCEFEPEDRPTREEIEPSERTTSTPLEAARIDRVIDRILAGRASLEEAA